MDLNGGRMSDIVYCKHHFAINSLITSKYQFSNNSDPLSKKIYFNIYFSEQFFCRSRVTLDILFKYNL